MDKNEVLTLINAGFTADEIREMLADPEPQPAPDPQPAPEPEAPEEPEAPKQPEPAQPAGVPDAANSLLSGLKDTLESMQATLESIQKANMRASVGVKPKDPLEVAADVVAQVILPPKRNTKGDKR